MPRWIYTAIILVNLVMVIPPVLIFKARASKSRNPRIHLFYDMDRQPRYLAQSTNPLFADGRAMRLPVPGTVAIGELNMGDHYYRGIVDGAWAKSLPSEVTVNSEFIERGRQRYRIYCTPCHGISGHGDGLVARRSTAISMANPEEIAWTVADLTLEKTRQYPIGQIYNSITNGINTMPPYKASIPVRDRWAIAAWVRALQYSQSAELTSLPPDRQAKLAATKPKKEEN